jgi:hypothetical protein
MRRQDTREVIAHRDVKDLISEGVDLTATASTPEVWYWKDWDETNNVQTIAFWPLPSATITVEMSVNDAVPSALAGADLIELPPGFLSVLREGVRAYARESANQPELAQAAWQRFFEKLEVQRKRYVVNREEVRSRVRPDGVFADLPIIRDAQIPRNI